MRKSLKDGHYIYLSVLYLSHVLHLFSKLKKNMSYVPTLYFLLYNFDCYIIHGCVFDPESHVEQIDFTYQHLPCV